MYQSGSPDTLFERTLVRIASNRFLKPFLEIVPTSHVLNETNAYHEWTREIIEHAVLQSRSSLPPEIQASCEGMQLDDIGYGSRREHVSRRRSKKIAQPVS